MLESKLAEANTSGIFGLFVLGPVEKKRKLTLNLSMSRGLTVESKLAEAKTSGIFGLFVPGPAKIKKKNEL